LAFRAPLAFLVLGRGRTIALLEAAAAAGVAPLDEGRREVIVAQYRQTNFSGFDAERDALWAACLAFEPAVALAVLTPFAFRGTGELLSGRGAGLAALSLRLPLREGGAVWISVFTVKSPSRADFATRPSLRLIALWREHWKAAWPALSPDWRATVLEKSKGGSPRPCSR
jgi:hypothetical protein